ncbi:MAG: hypothetical protein CO189_02835 [candidate division Zixibacteria bacterium CG_4_9_14_3_um_filter_46_8]|nr:MAG: hypothetical protein CO189_02835 [candidate division Zixibacteria bacterium CG_4_9_14_3_um_filter_46_8]
MWWNVIGFLMTFCWDYFVSILVPGKSGGPSAQPREGPAFSIKTAAPKAYYIVLIVGFIVTICLLLAIQKLVAGIAARC